MYSLYIHQRKKYEFVKLVSVCSKMCGPALYNQLFSRENFWQPDQKNHKPAVGQQIAESEFLGHIRMLPVSSHEASFFIRQGS